METRTLAVDEEQLGELQVCKAYRLTPRTTPRCHTRQHLLVSHHRAAMHCAIIQRVLARGLCALVGWRGGDEDEVVSLEQDGRAAAVELGRVPPLGRVEGACYTTLSIELRTPFEVDYHHTPPTQCFATR